MEWIPKVECAYLFQHIHDGRVVSIRQYGLLDAMTASLPGVAALVHDLGLDDPIRTTPCHSLQVQLRSGVLALEVGEKRLEIPTQLGEVGVGVDADDIVATSDAILVGGDDLDADIEGNHYEIDWWSESWEVFVGKLEDP